MSNQATNLIPNWTMEDYLGEEPYKWLYERRTEKFLFQTLLSRMTLKAKELGVVGFTRMWNGYCEAVSPKNNVLGVNATDFPEQPVQLQCGKYLCDYSGVHYEGRMGENIIVCSHPIMPVKRIVNVDTGYESTQIAFKRGNQKWRSLIVSSDVLASAQKIVALSKSGIGVNSESSKELVKYITDIVEANIDDMPVQSSTSHLGWLPDGQFVPYAEGIEYDGESPENQRMFAAFTECGSYAEWLKVAEETRQGKSVPARIALAGAFAAPLVSLVNGLPFIIHFHGASGTGKSVALMLSASVWAEPTVGGAYIKTFGATKTSHEVMAAFCCNVPMYIDELQIQADRKSFDDLIYMLCEGASKGRGTKEGGLQTQKRWSNCILTTGEMPIVQDNSGGGAAVRTIEVEYGGEAFFEDSRDVADRLKANYGWAGRKFIEAIQKGDMLKQIRDIQKKYEKELAGKNIHGKQMLSASILLAADDIAGQVIFKDGKSLTAKDILPYLVTNDQANQNKRCYDWLMGVIASNPKRFETDDNNGELWGFRDGSVIYMIRSVFDRILIGAGYSPVPFLKWAKRTNRIQTDDYDSSKNNSRLTKRKTINGHPTKCVALVSDEFEGMTEVEDDDDMPF